MSFHKLSKPFEPNFTFNEPFDIEIKLIKTGPYHIILVTSNNEIYSYGHNQPNSCHLGFEEHINYLNKFQKVNLNIGEIKLLECSPYFTVFVNKENEVWVFGKEWFKKNSNNQKQQQQQQFIGKLKNINFQVKEVKTNFLQFTKIPLDDDIRIVTDIYSSFVGFFTIRTEDNVLYFFYVNKYEELNNWLDKKL
ncbi:hypothetical protein ABK040_010169 [Willaertia magna]